MLKKYFYLFAIGLIWGSQFLFQQQAVNDLSPIWVAAGRAVIGAVTLILLAALFGLRSQSEQGKSKRQLTYFAIAFLEATVPFVGVAWGQQFLDTAVVAILMGTIPFFTILLSPIVIRGAQITSAGLMSVTIGFTGLVALFYPQLTSGSEGSSLTAALVIIGASACFGVALLLLKKISDENPILVARNVLTSAAAQLLIIASFIQAPWTLELTTGGAISVFYLGVMCAGVVYFLYMALIAEAGPVFASLNNYLVPLVGVLLGATFNNELLPVTTWFALGLICVALAVNQFGDRWIESGKKRVAA